MTNRSSSPKPRLTSSLNEVNPLSISRNGRMVLSFRILVKALEPRLDFLVRLCSVAPLMVCLIQLNGRSARSRPAELRRGRVGQFGVNDHGVGHQTADLPCQIRVGLL